MNKFTQGFLIGVLTNTIVLICVFSIFYTSACEKAYGAQWEYLKEERDIIYCGNGKGEIKKI